MSTSLILSPRKSPLRVQSILKAFENGYSVAHIHSGHLNDLDVDYRNQYRIRELRLLLTLHAKEDHNLVTLRCSLSKGIEVQSLFWNERGTKSEVKALVKRHYTTKGCSNEQESLNLIRAIREIANTPVKSCQLLIWIEFGEHLLPYITDLFIQQKHKEQL